MVEEFTKLDAKIRVEVARLEDEPILEHFIVEEFHKQDPLLLSLRKLTCLYN